MIEAIEFWNEPNNLSHWDYRIDPDWAIFSRMVASASERAAQLAPDVRRVFGGICPIDPAFIARVEAQGALYHMDAIGVHGFPADWDSWPIDDWPRQLDRIREISDLPLWITEVGTASMGAEEIQVVGLRRTAQVVPADVERVFWYSLMDLPRDWPPIISPLETAEGSNYFRHFNMGLIRADGRAKLAAAAWDSLDRRIGLCQWFHWHDPRLTDAGRWLHELRVRRLRTCISWADWHRPHSRDWFDRMMDTLAGFDLTVILCFTPPSRGVQPDVRSPPRDPAEFAWFTEEVIRRYCLRDAATSAAATTHGAPQGGRKARVPVQRGA